MPVSTRKKLAAFAISIAAGVSIYGGSVALQNTSTPAPGDSPTGSPISPVDAADATPGATPVGTPGATPVGTPVATPAV
jgi:hypothetical protein